MVGEDVIVAIVKLLRRQPQNTVEILTPPPTITQIWSSSTGIHITDGSTYVFPAGLWDVNVQNEHASLQRMVTVQCNINGTWRTMYDNDLVAGYGISVGVWISDGANLRIMFESNDLKARLMRMS